MKFTKGLFCVAALGLALGLGACNKNEDKCCGTCGDKAVMKDGSVNEASAKSCGSECSKSCGDKAKMKDGTVKEGAAKSCESSCTSKKTSCSDAAMKDGTVKEASAKSCEKSCSTKKACPMSAGQN
ncbi:MAG: hypothetical protein KF768_10245 [Phycisphaeraceae bacterium]|nr:hypothetical protein [Phycisphaeraceae bacterium]